MLLDTFALSIAGRRDNNEDSVCAQPELGLFIVADGMGGYEGGEVASALAVDAIRELVRRTAGDADVTWPYAIDPSLSIAENEVMVATRLADARISQHRSGRLGQMGSTVAVLRLAPRDRAVIAHVGDSRIYRLRAGEFVQLTIDHSLLAQMVAAGTPPADTETFPFRHVVTRALGTPHAEPEVRLHRAEPGDVYLLCSDGLSEVLAPATIAALLAASAETACRALVDAAYAAGSRDNISAVVVRVGG
jgi:serine/threonine protein phosphatase PrpC